MQSLRGIRDIHESGVDEHSFSEVWRNLASCLFCSFSTHVLGFFPSPQKTRIFKLRNFPVTRLSTAKLLSNFSAVFYVLANSTTRPIASYVACTFTRSSGHACMIPITCINSDFCKYAFFPRTLLEWNKLPRQVVITESLELFTGTISTFFTYYL